MPSRLWNLCPGPTCFRPRRSAARRFFVRGMCAGSSVMALAMATMSLALPAIATTLVIPFRPLPPSFARPPGRRRPYPLAHLAQPHRLHPLTASDRSAWRSTSCSTWPTRAVRCVPPTRPRRLEDCQALPWAQLPQAAPRPPLLARLAGRTWSCTRPVCLTWRWCVLTGRMRLLRAVRCVCCTRSVPCVRG